MNQRDALDRIVASFHDATFDDALWPATSALIDEACGIKGSFLCFAHRGSHDEVTLLAARLFYRGQQHGELKRLYLNDYYPIDERVPRLRQLPDGQVAHIRDLSTEHELKTCPTYNEFLFRAEFQDGLNVRLDGPHGTHVAWAISDPTHGGGWSAAQIDMIERILPHLRQHVGVRQALVDAGALGASLAGLLDNSRLGVIQLDRRGRIVEANDTARDLLRKSDGVSDRHGNLHAFSPADDADLQKLMRRALPPLGVQGASGSMTARRPSILPRLVLHVSPVGSGRLDFRPMRVAVLVLVVDPASPPRIDADLVAESLGLTPAESQVATLLAQGKTVREVAAATGRSERTIRWHMHHICSKHGISRQVELVQLVFSATGVLGSRH